MAGYGGARQGLGKASAFRIAGARSRLSGQAGIRQPGSGIRIAANKAGQVAYVGKLMGLRIMFSHFASPVLPSPLLLFPALLREQRCCSMRPQTKSKSAFP